MAKTNTAAALTANDLESIRQDASERGDCDTSSLANVALWAPSLRKRAAANRKLARMVAS
jgi:hypothetical protein